MFLKILAIRYCVGFYFLFNSNYDSSGYRYSAISFIYSKLNVVGYNQ